MPPVDLNSLDSYDFELPESLIAQRALEPRDSSRLLVVHRDRGTWEHRKFTDLPEYLDSRDLLVANNTQVIRARLLGHRLVPQDSAKGGTQGPFTEGGKIEFLLLEELEPLVWEGMFHAAAKHRPGIRFRISTPDGRGLHGELIRGASDSPHGTVVARFDRDPVESGAGVLPLPPYIERSASGDDDSSYQTVYAKKPGSAAAPTAGLHFTPRVMEALRTRGVGWEEITLQVGLGTFRPVKEQDITRHLMHEERFEIDPGTASRVTAAKREGRRVVAVGTTSVRALESAWSAADGLRSGPGRTSIFIHPAAVASRAFRFQVVDRLITNFHLPKSTLLMLVSAFAGRELVLEAYRDAVREKYRFFSYGDAMVIL